MEAIAARFRQLQAALPQNALRMQGVSKTDGGTGLAVLAVQQIRRMRGGAQGQLMLGADGHIYVVKFQNNPQHMRVLANEFLASRLALAAGLTVPQVELVEVSSWLIDNTPDLEMDLGRTRERCRPGLQFGSRYAAGTMPGQLADYLPDEQLAEVRNLAEFAGILALDKWTGNANGRQAVFTRRQRERRYKAVFIDFGYCFHAGEWRFEDAPLRGVYYRNAVYQGIRAWSAFEPWLTRMETISAETVWAAAGEIPPEWYGGDLGEMEALVEKLLGRRSRIRELIEAFARSDRRPFPDWGNPSSDSAPGDWSSPSWRATITPSVH
jgi:HipA-like kinase